MGQADQCSYQDRREGKKLVKGHDPEWMLRERLARRYGYRGPFDPALNEDLNHPARRPLLIESMTSIPDIEQVISDIFHDDFPSFILRALDILGVKLLYAHGYKADGIYSIPKAMGGKKRLPKEAREVKHVFTLDDGTVVKVV